MKKPLSMPLLMILFGLPLVGGLAYASHHFCQPAQATCTNVSQVETDTTDQGSTKLASRYYTYTPVAATQALTAGHRVVLYFWAPWCTSCASLDLEIENNPELIPTNAIVLRVPYDSAENLKSKYHIITQHSFVEIDSNQEPIQTWVGGDGDELISRLK